MEKGTLSATDIAGNGIALKEIWEALGIRSFGFLLMLFSLPALLPVTIIRQCVAVPLIIISIQMIVQLHTPWLPSLLGNHTVDRRKLGQLIKKAMSSNWMLPAWLSPLPTPLWQKVVGIVSLACAVAIVLPLSSSHALAFVIMNALPAIAIFGIALGLVMSDVKSMLIWMMMAVISVVMSIAEFLCGGEAVIKFINSLW